MMLALVVVVPVDVVLEVGVVESCVGCDVDGGATVAEVVGNGRGSDGGGGGSGGGGGGGGEIGRAHV